MVSLLGPALKNMEILFFLAGIAVVLMPSFLPLCVVALGLFFDFSHRFIMCFVVGCLWALLHQWWETPRRFDGVERNTLLTGVIASIPKHVNEKIQFEFLLMSPTKARVLLTCFDHCPALQLGQAWHVTAKLKVPRQYRNPGGFDYAALLRAKHIAWTGFTKQGTFKRDELPIPLSVRWLTWREALAAPFAISMLDENSRGVVEALTLGLSTHLSEDIWGLFRRTGTTHLMVISGAHIGLVAGLTYQCVHYAWRHVGRLSAYVPAMRVARYVGLLFGFLYALLAGFGVPAERATLAFGVLSLRYFVPFYFTPGQAWRMALWFVLFFEPHAVLQPGFYLSFIAVAILISTHQRFQCGKFKKMLLLQGACLFGLMPLTLYWFNYGSLNGFFANLIAIPWVSFVLIPLGLVSVFCSLPSVLFLLHHAIHILLVYLAWIDTFSWVNMTYVFSDAVSPMVMMLVMAIAVLIPVRALFGILVLLFVSACMPTRLFLRSHEAEIDVLDVGQGLAIIVRTAHHTLIYDTGMKFYHGSDIGQLVLVPYLKHVGVTYLDKVVISHPDLDHRGGLLTLSQSFKTGILLVDDPEYYKSAQNCHDFPAWVWDGVMFQFLPIQMPLQSKNNHSCVLKVSNQNTAMLLTGDIERPAEAYLVKNYASELRSSVLLVPHHGSKTSSSLAFLKAVSPQFAVVSYGLDNRYHFPHQEALSNYTIEKIPVYSTMQYGLLKIILSQRAVVLNVS